VLSRRLQREKEVYGSIRRACWRELGTSFYGAVRKCEMAARVKEVAILKNAVLELPIINHDFLTAKLLIVHKLDFMDAKGGSRNLDLFQG
jgi:hypothetical protein